MSSSLPEERILSVNQLIQEIVESNFNGNRFCFILGSGASVESGIPTGNELEKRWMKCIMGEEDDGECGKKKEPEEIRRIAKALKEASRLEYSFSEIEKAWKECKKDPSKWLSSKYYFDIYKLRFFPDKINGYRYLERVMEHCKPSIGYHTLSLLLSKENKNNLVITTNFDSLMEDALSIYSNKKPLIVGHESLTGFMTTDVQRPIIAKVHRGLFYDPFNTPETTNQLSEEWRKALRIAFNIYTPIVIGYGGGDSSLMAFLEDKETIMRHGIYWCYLETHEPDENIRKLVEDKDGYFVSIKGFDALMLEIGKQIYDESISPTSVEQYLNKQTEEQIKQYNNQWNELNKKPELETIVEQINKSEQIKEEQRQKEGKLTYWDFARRASRAEKNKDFDTAIKEWTKAIEIQPERAEAYNGRGYAYGGLGKYRDAIQNYSKAIELDPLFAVAYINRGATYGYSDENEKALQDLKTAIDLDPSIVEAYVHIGNIYEHMLIHDEAIKNLNKAMEIKPEYIYAYNSRGCVYKNMGKYEEAIRDFEKVIKIDPKYANPYRQLGSIFIQKKEYEKAVEELSKAIGLNDQYTEAYEDRAKAYRALEKEGLAQKDEETAKKLREQKKQ